MSKIISNGLETTLDQIYFYELSLLLKMVFSSVVVKHWSEYSFRYKFNCFDVPYINLLSQMISLKTSTVKIGYHSIVIIQPISQQPKTIRSSSNMLTFEISNCKKYEYATAPISDINSWNVFNVLIIMTGVLDAKWYQKTALAKETNCIHQSY